MWLDADAEDVIRSYLLITIASQQSPARESRFLVQQAILDGRGNDTYLSSTQVSAMLEKVGLRLTRVKIVQIEESWTPDLHDNATRAN